MRAFAIRDRLERNPDLPLKRIAEAEGVSPSYVTRLHCGLSYLAPDIVTAIVDGQQPPELTAEQAHEKHPSAAQLGSPEEAARVRARLISRSIPSRPVLSLGTDHREPCQPMTALENPYH